MGRSVTPIRVKIRLPQDGRADGPQGVGFDSAKGAVILEKLSSSIVHDFTNWTNADGKRLTKPELILHVDPTHLWVDLRAEEESAMVALTWFNDAFNLDRFRKNVDSGIRHALHLWARKDYGRETHCNGDEANGVRDLASA